MKKNHHKNTFGKITKKGESAQPNFKIRLSKWIDETLNPIMMKVGNQKHLSSIRDAFASLVPLIIAGSLGILINALIFGGAGSGKVSLLAVIDKLGNPNWNWNATVFSWSNHTFELISQIGGLTFGYINVATLGAFALYIAFLIPYFLATYRKFKSPVLCGATGLAAFLIAIMGQVQYFMDAKGLIIAILIGFLAGELFIWFGNMNRLEIKLPKGVPPAVGKSFAVFLPAIITLTGVALINLAFLAPALASTGWTVNGYVNASDHNIWGINNLTYDKFNEWIKKTYGSSFSFKSILADGKTTNNLDKLLKQWGNKVTNIKKLISELQGTLTKNGFNLLGQYMHTLNGGVINNITAWQNSVATFTVYGSGQVMLSLRYDQVKIASDAFGFGAAVYKFISSWFISFATSNGGLVLAILYTFFVSFFWWFGIHGNNALSGIFTPIWLMILGINSVLITEGNVSGIFNGSSGVGVFAKPFFDSYVSIGGSGATLAFVIMTLFFSKRRDLKEVSKYALPAGCFNINEPVIFGFPIVLNFRFLLPFFLAPMTCLTLGWVGVAVLKVANVPYIATPWTAPWFLVALLSTGISPWAPVLALVCFGASVAIWTPFVFLDNFLFFKSLSKSDPEAYEEAKRYVTDAKYRKKIKVENKKNKLVELADIKKMKEKKRAEKQATKKPKKKKAIMWNS